MTGLLADFLTAYGSNGITGLDNENIVLTDTSVSVTDLNTLDLLTQELLMLIALQISLDQ